MIQQVRWDNTDFTTAGTPSEVYTSDSITTTTSTGYVGLMYLSDYGYGSLSSVCDRSIAISSYSGNTNGKTWII